jgi:hypothetical protein
MFGPQHDAALGIPVTNGTYPEGEEGIQLSLRTICKKIREGMATAVMKSYAGNVLKTAGFPESIRARAAALLEHVRKAVAYAPDALGTEQIQTAMVTLCVEGAPVCIPIADCDDLVVALGTLCAAVGMDVEVVRQFFGGEHQQHVLVQVLTEEGAWFSLDPSSKMPAGEKARAVRETTCSPWDGTLTGLSNDAQFVGIGALPVFVWGRGWRRVPETATLEASMRGLGAIWEGAAALQPQIEWVGKAWGIVDASGRSWSQANADALARAASRNWPANDAVARSDLLALLVSSAIQSRAIASMPDIGPEASDALTRTWLVLIKKLGYDPAQFKSSDIRARMEREGASQANLALFDLLLIVAAGLVGAIIYAIGMYAIVTIINNLISKYFVDQELIRKHAEWQKVVDRHLNDPSLPWTPEERQILKDLEAAQAGLAEKQAEVPNTYQQKKDEGFWDSPWAWVGVAGILGGVVLAVVYKDDIKRLLAPPPRRLRA